jgi:hypothetical protein
VLRPDAAFALPGIVVHELGHYLLCLLCGAKVQEVVFFEAEGPSGYVAHSVPRRLIQHATIVAGPLILNSILGFLLFRSAVTQFDFAIAELQNIRPLPSLQVIVSALLGASIALHALPSHADAVSLWKVTLDRVGQGHLLAVLAAPVALALMLANQLRRYWVDWVYAIGLAVLAVWLPVR